MDNASKNAGDMISSLQMKYNRGRQAAITNELVDIITGASGACHSCLSSFLCPCAVHRAVSFVFLSHLPALTLRFSSPLVNSTVTQYLVMEGVKRAACFLDWN
jgi:hypothetical protein